MISRNKKKILYITGTRADFGLMTPILDAIKKSKLLQLQLFITGEHLMPEFGETVKIVKKTFPEAKKIDAVFKDDSRKATVDFVSRLLIQITEVFFKNKPDFVLTLGDRPEMLTIALACLYLGIPTGAIHGGERTSTVDEVARHAIAKLSHIHFPATEESAERLKKMGEDKWRIHTVGAPALDVVLNEKLQSREELFKELNLDSKKEVILVTQHPVSGEFKQAGKQMKIIIDAVKRFNLPIVIIYSHADAGGREMIKIIQKEKNNPLFHIFQNIEYKKFLALEREATVWIGNSSAALIESSSFKTPIINVGTRQLGRQRGDNVIDVGYDEKEIISAIKKSLNDKKYLAKLKKIKNPWGDGKTGSRVVKILEDLKIDDKLLNKQICY